MILATVLQVLARVPDSDRALVPSTSHIPTTRYAQVFAGLAHVCALCPAPPPLRLRPIGM